MAKKVSKKTIKKKVQMLEDVLEELTMRQQILRRKREAKANQLDACEADRMEAIENKKEEAESLAAKKIAALNSTIEFYDKEEAKLAESIKQISAAVESYKREKTSKFELGMGLLTSAAQMTTTFGGLYLTGRAINNSLAKDVEGAMENKTTAQFGRGLVQKFFGVFGKKR